MRTQLSTPTDEEESMITRKSMSASGGQGTVTIGCIEFFV